MTLKTIHLQQIATRIAQQNSDTEDSGQYGGGGPFNLPPDHIAAMQVPKGGSCCANCAFVDVDNHACKEPNYITWNGGDSTLPPLELDEICSDWYTPGVEIESAEEE